MDITLRLRGFREALRRTRNNPRELKRLQKRALSRVAQIGINIIQARTEDGVGFKDGAFRPYSPGYAAFRASRGRGQRPNLFFTGQMLGSMTSKANHRKAEIFFGRASESKKAAFNNQTRPFFGFSRDEERELLRDLERFIR